MMYPSNIINSFVPNVPVWHCMKSVRIQSFSGPCSVGMWENMDQKNSEHEHFLRSVIPSTNIWKPNRS